MPTYAVPLSNGRQSPQGFLPILSKLFTSQGVIDNALTVSEQLTPNMTVLVSGSLSDDFAVFIASNGHFIQAWNSEPTNVTIPSNNTGVTKTDALVAYIDLDAGDPDVPNNPDALKFESVRRDGVLLGLPDDEEIKLVIGATNPYMVLSEITVENGATAISSSNILDVRPRAGLDASILAEDSIQTQHIQDGAVDLNKIGNAQVITDKIANSAVTTAKIADNNVTTAKILNSNVTPAKLENFPVTTPSSWRLITIKNLQVWVRRYTFSPGTIASGGSSNIGTIGYPAGETESTVWRTTGIRVAGFAPWWAITIENNSVYVKNVGADGRSPGTVTIDVTCIKL